MDYFYLSAGLLWMASAIGLAALSRLYPANRVLAALLPTGLLGGVAYWFELLSIALPGSSIFRWLAFLGWVLFSLLFFEAGRRALMPEKWNHRGWIAFIPGVLAGIIVWIVFPDLPRVALFLLVFGFSGMALCAFALIRSKPESSSERELQRSGLALLALAVLLLATSGTPDLSALPAGSPLLTGFVGLVTLALLAAYNAFFWRAVRAAQRETEHRIAFAQTWFHIYTHRWVPWLVSGVLLAGFIFTAFIGSRELSRRQVSLIQQLNLMGQDLQDGYWIELMAEAHPISAESLERIEDKLARFSHSLPLAEGLILVKIQEQAGEITAISWGEFRRKATRDHFPSGAFVDASRFENCWKQVLAGEFCLFLPPARSQETYISAVHPFHQSEANTVYALIADFPLKDWKFSYTYGRLAGGAGTILVLFLGLVVLGLFHYFSHAHQGLLSARERLELALRGARMAIWEWEPSTGRLLTDDRWLKLLGLSAEEKTNSMEDLLDLLSADERQRLEFALEAHIRQQSSLIEYEFTIQRPDENSPRWLQITGRVSQRDPSGAPRVVSGTLQSVQERHRLYARIRESQQKYQSLFQASPAGIFLMDQRSGRFLETNESFAQLLGYRAGDIEFLDFWQITPPESVEEERQLLQKLEPGEVFGPVEKSFLGRDGSTIPVLIQGVRNAGDDAIHRVLASVQDLRPVRRAEYALVQTQELNRSALANLTEIVYQIDGTGRWMLLNPAWEQITGYTVEESLGRPFQDFLHPADVTQQERLYKRSVAQREELVTSQVRYLRKDGSVIWMRISARNFYNTQGELTHILGTLRDITRERASARILEAVASLNSTLLASRLENENWDEPLELLGQATETDRVYVFHDSLNPATGRPAVSLLAEWNSGNSLPQVGNPDLQLLDYEEAGVADWRPALLEGKEINALVSTLNPTARQHLEKQEIASLLLMPIFIGTEFFGFIGFDQCHHPRSWPTGELALLRSAAGAIGLRLIRQRDEDGLVKATEAARQAARDAEEANRAKSTFLATMSHEIRTPLNAVIGMTSLLEDTRLSPQQADFVRTVQNASNTLLDLINDILDYSKIESGRFELAREPFPLEKTILEPLEILSRNALDQQLALTVYISPSAPRSLIGDRVRLKQVLLNLLSNAVKFTSQGEVSLVVDCDPMGKGHWRISFAVRDTGIGISDDVLPRLFKPFLQADSSITRRYGGTGLGLAICRKIVQHMGSDIQVSSTAGEGSEFSFSVELSEAPEGGPADPPSDKLRGTRALVFTESKVTTRFLQDCLRYWGVTPRIETSFSNLCQILENDAPNTWNFVLVEARGHEAQIATWAARPESEWADPNRPHLITVGATPETVREWESLFPFQALPSPAHPGDLRQLLLNICQDPTRLPASVVPQNLARPKSKLRVLVAEDNPNNQKVVRLILKKCGCDALIVENGKLAVEAISSQPFDFVILDLQMPVMDGLTAVGQIRNLPNLNPRPVLMALTANAFAEDRENCLASGFDRYASKPITLKQMQEIIDEIADHSAS